MFLWEGWGRNTHCVYVSMLEVGSKHTLCICFFVRGGVKHTLCICFFMRGGVKTHIVYMFLCERWGRNTHCVYVSLLEVGSKHTLCICFFVRGGVETHNFAKVILQCPLFSYIFINIILISVPAKFLFQIHVLLI